MRIILQSSLLTLFCIFLDSTEAYNKKPKTYDMQKDGEEKLTQPIAGQKFNRQSEMISDEINDTKQIKARKKCKGKSCKYESSDEDDDFRGEREEHSRKYMGMDEQRHGKYSNDFLKVRKPLKHHHEGKTSTKNMLKNGSSEQREYSDEEETTTSSKNRIIENVKVVKDKLTHLKKKIGDIEPKEFGSGKKDEMKKKRKIHKDFQTHSKSYQTDGINRKQGADDSSEEHQESYKEHHYKIKPKLLGSGEDTQRKNRRKRESKSVLYESETNQKESKIIKNSEENDSMELGIMERKTEDGVVDKIIESDENISYEDKKTCEKIKGGGGKEDGNCDDVESHEDESILHNKKHKFSIKYAHEKKKVFHNKHDNFVKKLHGIDKKKRRLGDEDDDSDEDEELPKRLPHVIDDEE